MDNKIPSFDNLTNLYSVAKTLRFELRPQFSTLKHIKNNEIIQKGEELRSHYGVFKKILDQVLSKLIDESLDDIHFSQADIEQYKEFRFKSRDQFTEKDAANFKILKEAMKKQIDDKLNSGEKKAVFEDPVKYLLNEAGEYSDIIGDQRQSVEAFHQQKGYLSGYFQNRQNIFDRKTNETSVAYRIVEDNLLVFLDNQRILSCFLDNISDKDNFIRHTIEDLDININFETLFELDYFNRTLSQSGIEKYNLLISGKTTDQNTKLKGINELIKEYIDQHQSEKLKKVKLKKLYKQILSESTTSSFTFDIVETNEDLLQMIDDYLNFAYGRIQEKMDFLKKIESLKSSENQDLNFSQIHLSRKNLKRLSAYVFNDFSLIERELEEKFVAGYDGKITKKALESYRKQRTLSLQEIYDGLQDVQYEQNRTNISTQGALLSGVADFIYQNLDCNVSNLLSKIQLVNQDFSKILQEQNAKLEEDQKTPKNTSFNKTTISTIKTILDFYKNLQVNLSLFYMDKEEGNLELDSEFYSDFDEFYSDLREIIPVYNKARNYLTKKPFSTEKTKLIFDSPQLLNGWSKSKESDCLGTIFKKGQKYYIGIINSNTKAKADLFETYNFPESIKDPEYYEKMNLFFLSDLKRDFPKKYFSEKWDKKHSIPAELRKKYDYYRLDTNKDERKEDLAYHQELIAYYQNCLEKDDEWQVYNFKFKDPKDYTNVNEFLADLSSSTYRMEFTKIPTNYIKKLVDDSKLYFFQLYSKDFSESSKGKPNLHTLYLKAIFDANNAEKFNYSYKISGEAEIFYRPASLEYKVTHEKNKPIQNKNNHEKKSIFSYDLFKDRRYMVDKFFLHLPIELNRTAPHQNGSLVNQEVNQIVKFRQKNYFLGIDRGERHLIYLVLIDEEGKIIKQQTLNQISSQYKDQDGKTETVTTDYHDLLDKKEKQRKENLQEWQTVENIKELKAGFLSNVVNKIGKIITEYQPVIMLENLNTGFKNSRIKIEKQVYQKFEKALIDKFNYFIRKDLDPEVAGGLYHALQLTKEYSKQYNGKQNGIIYYIPANYTSNIDPTTGFISSFIPTRYENIEKTKELISKFNDISYDKQEDLFCFEIDYRKIRPDAKLWDQKVWQIYTHGDRFEMRQDHEIVETRLDQNKQWTIEPIEPNEEFKQLFNKYGIDLNQDLKQQILFQGDADFFRRFLYLLKLTLQMRNSRTVTASDRGGQNSNRDNDYIISPVKNSKGVFYDSRRDYEEWPENADANGAYNIARKGLIMLKNLRNGVTEKKICDISTEEWLKFVEGISKEN